MFLTILIQSMYKMNTKCLIKITIYYFISDSSSNLKLGQFKLVTTLVLMLHKVVCQQHVFTPKTKKYSF